MAAGRASRRHARGADRSLTATFDPLDVAEVPSALQIEEAEDYAVSFRRTLKLRLILRGEAPAVRAIRAETPGVWRRQELTITFGCGRGERAVWDGRATARHGAILGAAVEGQPPSTVATWQLPTDGGPRTVRLAVRRADSPSPGDATILTLQTEPASFSFRPVEVATVGPLSLSDFGVFIAAADGSPTRRTRGRLRRCRGDRSTIASAPSPSRRRNEPSPRFHPCRRRSKSRSRATCPSAGT